MTTQQLEQKFSLIGDPIVRAVVRHLYEPEFEERMLESASSAKSVLVKSFDWENQILGLSFWDELADDLEENPNYTFAPKELQQVRIAYPELFNADGSLKADSIKTTHDTDAPCVYDELQVGSLTTKAELNRNEIALHIFYRIAFDPEYSENSPQGLARIAFELTDAFIKQSRIQ